MRRLGIVDRSQITRRADRRFIRQGLLGHQSEIIVTCPSERLAGGSDFGNEWVKDHQLLPEQFLWLTKLRNGTGEIVNLPQDPWQHDREHNV
jgi:hypothetical protein